MESKTLALTNAAGSPGSTFAGIAVLFSALSQQIAQGGLPTTSAGWTVLGLQALGGFAAILGR